MNPRGTDIVVTNFEYIARNAVNSLLENCGLDGVSPDTLGPYAECIGEMQHAWEQGGVDAARRAYSTFAEEDKAIAALRAADPQEQRRKWSVAELYGANFPEPKFIVPGLLTVGLNNLAARPKIGKSWFALQVSAAVGAGGNVLGKQVEKGKVLYLALEDGPRRIKERLLKQQAPAYADIDFFYDWKPLSGEGLGDLMTEIETHGYDFVVIDTLARALGFIDPNKQAESTKYLGALQRLALDREVTILLIDHHRKGASGDGGGDVIDDVLGATGKSGVLDVSMGLYRKRGERIANLKVTGRDIDEQELAVKFDITTCCWQLATDASGVKPGSLQALIVDDIRDTGSISNVSLLARRLGKQKSNIQREVMELVGKGRLGALEKEGRTQPYKLIE